MRATNGTRNVFIDAFSIEWMFGVFIIWFCFGRWFSSMQVIDGLLTGVLFQRQREVTGEAAKSLPLRRGRRRARQALKRVRRGKEMGGAQACDEPKAEERDGQPKA